MLLVGRQIGVGRGGRSAPRAAASTRGARGPARRRYPRATSSPSARRPARDPRRRSRPRPASRRACRSRSLVRMSSGVGTGIHAKSIRAPRSIISTRLRRGKGTISTAVPFLPARPVRPERCCSVSASRGSSTWTTRLSVGRSIPRAATSVATQTRARRSRIAWSAWLRSFCAMLARQRDRGEPALDQAGVEVADIVARRAEQHRRLRLVEAQQVDDGVLDVRRADRDRLIGDVAMPAILADGRDAQRVALILLGQRDDRARHRRREQQACGARAGVASSKASRSSRKPMSSISSASSSTATLIADRSSAPRSLWSLSRPGVPTTICAPWLSERRSRLASIPPTQVAIRAPALA